MTIASTIALKHVFHEVFCPVMTAVVLRHEKKTGASIKVMGAERGHFESATIYTSHAHRRACERGYRPIVVTLASFHHGHPDGLWRLCFASFHHGHPDGLWRLCSGDNAHTRGSTMLKDLHDALTAASPEAHRLLAVLNSIATLSPEAP